MDITKFTVGKPFVLKPQAGLPGSNHVFDEEHIEAIMAAWYSERPLLITGEPGLGKSQLAHAVAQTQDWDLLLHVVHSRTEPEDLLFQVDHVSRLAKAQLAQHKSFNLSELDEKRYVIPGPVWWAYSPETAKLFYKKVNPEYKSPLVGEINNNHPSVLLLDEIDKADSDLPNALLEVLNNQSFHARAYDDAICSNPKTRPFVVITSNNHRPLPHAFLRRCIVINLTLKEGEEGIAQLTEVAKAHYPDMTPELVKQAANMVIQKRKNTAPGEYSPGTSEFLDLLKVLNSERYENDDKREQSLAIISTYILNKSLG